VDDADGTTLTAGMTTRDDLGTGAEPGV